MVEGGIVTSFVEDKKRSHHCGELRASHAGETVVLMGWAQTVRVHSRWVFVDLRDREGVTQILFQPEVSEQAYDVAARIRQEYVVAVEGTVALRGGKPNPKLPTGEIEVQAQEVEILSRAMPLPLQIEDDTPATEETRLEHRYLDLRRRPLVQALGLRSRMNKLLRSSLDELGFWEFETPILTKSTPEGARDFLVPSRTHPGQFFALPQSPQLFKQLLMVAGYDRYYQICRCFRDEDLRGDRQPEFTQLDLELSFVSPRDVQEVVEILVQRLWSQILGKELSRPFPSLSFAEAMERYGSDRPDLRYDLPLQDLTELTRGAAIPPLAEAGCVRGLALPPEAKLSRKQLDMIGDELRKDYDITLFGWSRRAGDGLSGGIGGKLDQATVPALCDRVGLAEGALVLLVAGAKGERTALAAGRMRERAADLSGVVPRDGRFALTWIEGFPMFEWDDEGHRWVARHHPFTSPRREDLPFLETDPERVQARAYDLVCNGNEIAGGSIRIHDPEVQLRVLSALGIDNREAGEKFGFLIEALGHGTPPHGGIAFGLDRLAMLLSGASSIREVIAFPKTTRAACLMTQAPSAVAEEQLTELGLATRSSS
jgi:aspartyl-tRNA synthetase